MEEAELERLRYPIGRFEVPEIIDKTTVDSWIRQLEKYPAKLKHLVGTLDEKTLQWTYRPGGWTLKQVVHHVADSHLHSYIRFKWTLTENQPIIKPYDEKRWADLFDYHSAPIAISLQQLEITHKKLVYLLKGLDESQLNRRFIHPDANKAISLKETIGHYAWHGEHHYQHISKRLNS